jgi:hypothetical protein
VLRRLSEQDFGVTRDDWRGGDTDGEKALALLRFGIAKRMIHVCAHMSSPDFEEMISSMARIQHKYEVLGSRSFVKAVVF